MCTSIQGRAVLRMEELAYRRGPARSLLQREQMTESLSHQNHLKVQTLHRNSVLRLVSAAFPAGRAVSGVLLTQAVREAAAINAIAAELPL